MATYRILNEGYIDRPFTLVSVQATQKIAGEDVEVTVNKGQEMFAAQIHRGDVIRVPNDFPVGEHMEPIDEAAKEAFAVYQKPKFHNNLDALESTMDMRSPEERMADALMAAQGRMAPPDVQGMIDAAVAKALEAVTAPPKLSLSRGNGK